MRFRASASLPSTDGTASQLGEFTVSSLAIVAGLAY